MNGLICWLVAIVDGQHAPVLRWQGLLSHARVKCDAVGPSLPVAMDPKDWDGTRLGFPSLWDLLDEGDAPLRLLEKAQL